MAKGNAHIRFYRRLAEQGGSLAHLAEPVASSFTAHGFHPDDKDEVLADLKARGHTDNWRQLTAALHDLTLPTPKSSLPWDEPHVQDATIDENRLHFDEFHRQVRQQAGLPDDTPDYVSKGHWKRGMTRGISMGHITMDQAKDRGWRGDPRQEGFTDYYTGEQKGGFQPLPKKLYHTSTAADAIYNQGLRTRGERGVTTAVGLGGGSDDTISTTTDKSLAHDVYQSLHEYHAVLNGRKTVNDMIEESKNPSKGKPFFDKLNSMVAGNEAKPGEMSGRLKNLRDRMIDSHYHSYDDRPGLTNVADAKKRHPGWEPHPDSEKVEMPDGNHLYSRWVRPASDDEHRDNVNDLYKYSFSNARAHSGGHRDPLFISNDHKAFAATNPNDFGIHHLEPKEGTQGYPLNSNTEHHSSCDSGEWKVHTGDVFHPKGYVEKPPVERVPGHPDMAHTAAEQSYRMQHQGPSPEDGDALHEIGTKDSYPPDARVHPEWYGAEHQETRDTIRRARGKPEQMVTIYRAQPHPHRTINSGDWVATAADYARQHGMQSDESQDWPVVKSRVPAKHLHGNNSLEEWTYHGPDIAKADVHFPGGTPHEAAVRTQVERPETGAADSIMVAIVPPMSIAKDLHIEGGEPVEEHHITLAYLGETKLYSKKQLNELPDLVRQWAKGAKHLRARIQGAGTFINEEAHVLWAAVDIPGGTKWRDDLADFLINSGYNVSDDHGWTPHLTLQYVDQKHPIRFLPKVEVQSWDVDDVWLAIGTKWKSYPLKGS